MEGRESLCAAWVQRIVSQLVKIPNRALGHNSAERRRELEIVRERVREWYDDQNAKRKMPKATQELKLLEKWLATICNIYILLFFCSYCVVSPYPPEASAGCPVFSVLVFFLFHSFFSSTLSSPSSFSSPAFCPPLFGIFHQRRVGLMVDRGIDALPTQSSFHYPLLWLFSLFSPSLSLAGAFFCVSSSGDTRRGGGWGQAGVEKKTERERKGREASLGRWSSKWGVTGRGRLLVTHRGGVCLRVWVCQSTGAVIWANTPRTSKRWRRNRQIDR